jgi:uroporphyrinogen-III synthase
VVPDEAHANALVAALAARIAPGARVLLPASSRALPTLGEGLRRLGAQVVQVEAYRNEATSLDLVAARAAIDAGTVGAVTFTSPSCVEELERALGRDVFERLLAERPRPGATGATGARGATDKAGGKAGNGGGAAIAVALGPTTAGALSARGIEPIQASPATLEGLAATASRVLNDSQIR